MRLYDSRHTATSLALDAGGDLKAVSENTWAHKDPGITLRTYRHVKAGISAPKPTISLAAALGDVEEETPDTGKVGGGRGCYRRARAVEGVRGRNLRILPSVGFVYRFFRVLAT